MKALGDGFGFIQSIAVQDSNMDRTLGLNLLKETFDQNLD